VQTCITGHSQQSRFNQTLRTIPTYVRNSIEPNLTELCISKTEPKLAKKFTKIIKSKCITILNCRKIQIEVQVHFCNLKNRNVTGSHFYVSDRPIPIKTNT